MESKKVPEGVEVIGLYFLVIGIFGLIFIPGGVIARSFGESNVNWGFYYTSIIFAFLLPIFLIVMGLELKKGKPWARTPTIIISFIYLLTSVLYWFSGSYLIARAVAFNPINLIFLIFINSYFPWWLIFLDLAIYGPIIGYLLFNKKVKEFFRK